MKVLVNKTEVQSGERKLSCKNIETITETLNLATHDHIPPDPGEKGLVIH